MAYIGRGTDKISNIEKLDTITFDGSSSYTLQKNSVNFTPSSANNLQVSIDGVVQAGNFTVSGSTIDFGVAIPATSTNDFIFHYGTGLITTPADGTVTTAKLADSSVSLAKLTATGTKDATTFLRGDNTFAAAGSPSIDDNGTATAITIDSSENVGINNASPSVELDVTGKIYASHRVAKNVQAWSTTSTSATTLSNLVLDGSYSTYLFTIIGTSNDTVVENKGLYFLTRTNTGYSFATIQNSGGGTLSHSSGTLTFASPTSTYRTWRASLLRLH